MINPNYIKTLALCLIVTLFSCGGGSGGGGGDDDPTPNNPEAAILISPLQDEECNQGNIISDTQSSVTFQWNAATYTDKYTLTIKNLEDNSIQNINSTTTSKSVTLLRGTPYSWKIVSKSNSTSATASSSTWKFYNAGDAIENYAPFPAGLVSPPMGGLTNIALNLSWTGSDIDNDIASYDVYLSTNNPPTTLEESTTNTNIDVSGLTADTVYYWRVVTHDDHGNNSQSPVFEFRTQL